jgi:hypothetical protein
VRDRFVPRHADAALQGAAAAGRERGQNCVVHEAVSLKAAPSYHAAARAVIPP